MVLIMDMVQAITATAVWVAGGRRIMQAITDLVVTARTRAAVRHDGIARLLAGYRMAAARDATFRRRHRARRRAHTPIPVDR